MLSIDGVSGSTLTLKYFGATTDPKQSESTTYIAGGSPVVRPGGGGGAGGRGGGAAGYMQGHMADRHSALSSRRPHAGCVVAHPSLPCCVPLPQTCTSTLTITGGKIAGLPASIDVNCPAGSYYSSKEMCPAW